MRIEHKIVDSWPKLAWYATWKKGGDTMQVLCGSGVEVREDRLFEGVWDGDFEEGAFDHSAAFFGSGLVLRGKEVVLVPTVGNYERIYVTADSNSAAQCASNSLLCWLTQRGEKLDSNRPDYYTDLCQINGKGHMQTLPYLELSNAGKVGLVNLSSWIIGEKKSWRETPRKGPSFSANFESYRLFLSESMKRILSNASSRHRKTALTVRTAVSEGFDSVAVSSLAAELGVKNGISVLGREDARAIGKKLGLKMTTRHRARCWLYPTWKTQEFHALPIGQQRPLGLFESIQEDSILFSGHLGDSVWSMDPGFTGDSMIRKSFSSILGGNSILEHRLRIGLFVIPIPGIGYWHWSTINEISTSPEMQKFMNRGDLDSIYGGKYSRPIPRRIGLEAGLSWNDFGIKKIAGGIAVPDVFVGISEISFRRYLKGVDDIHKSTYPKELNPYFHKNRYRWGIHWAHEGLKDRYRVESN